MRGFVAGTLALVVLFAVTQRKAAERTGAAADLIGRALYRALSPEVAGVPDQRKRKE